MSKRVSLRAVNMSAQQIDTTSGKTETVKNSWSWELADEGSSMIKAKGRVVLLFSQLEDERAH